MAKLRVKEIAKQKGFTLAKVAEELKIHPVNLSTTLNGNPTIATLEKIANVLGVDVTDLIETENKPIVSGFVKVDGEVIEITSVADLEKALANAKELE
ncbi:MAG: helix-turn-helix transcriptional regulator [Alistipes sp.]|nr:helix-turn-helix transcriptional regulator [Alistipes sp.]